MNRHREKRSGAYESPLYFVIFLVAGEGGTGKGPLRGQCGAGFLGGTGGTQRRRTACFLAQSQRPSYFAFVSLFRSNRNNDYSGRGRWSGDAGPAFPIGARGLHQNSRRLRFLLDAPWAREEAAWRTKPEPCRGGGRGCCGHAHTWLPPCNPGTTRYTRVADGGSVPRRPALPPLLPAAFSGRRQGKKCLLNFIYLFIHLFNLRQGLTM